MAADDKDIRIGPFALDRVLGSGAMGEVWGGRHVARDHPVAVKLSHMRHADAEAARSEFLLEARAMARLSHPGLVTILDLGTVSTAMEAASHGVLRSGDPFLVMERCDGSLSEVPLPLPWQSVVAVLLGILEPLAHAHARGVTHRDLKPANILMSTGVDGSACLKLADFGIADVAASQATRAGHHGTVAGTPPYMPPEQFCGRFREVGPWTDLYAVGCIGWRLLTRAYPVMVAHYAAMMAYHGGSGPQARLEASEEWPEGLRLWVNRCVERSPWDRFASAAQAAQALREAVHGLYDPATRLPTRRAGGGPRNVLSTLDAEETARTTGCDATIVQEPGLLPADSEGVGSAAERAIEAGLSLFGMRDHPIAGRRRERSLMWEVAQEAIASQALRILVLRGASGVGKSRLARWLCERSVEVGQGSDLRVHYDRGGDGSDGLAVAMGSAMRCRGLGHAEMIEHCRQRLVGRGCDASIADAASRVIALASSPDGGQASGPGRHHLLAKAVMALAPPLMPVLWLDDVQWSSEAPDIVRAFDAVRGAAVLVLTVQEEALAAEEGRQRWLASLGARDDCRVVRLRALAAADHAEAVAGLLPLTTELRVELCERTEGNPLFAQQIVTDWVEHRELVLGEHGFALADPEARLRLPESVASAWVGHLDRILEATADSDDVGLFLAAVLGLRVDRREWAAALAVAGEDSRGLDDALVAAGLAIPTRDGWAFRHGMLRETALGMARERGVLAMCHACAAEALASDQRPDAWLRRGLHLEAAGALEQAREAYAQSAFGWRDQSRFGSAERAVAHLARVREVLSLVPTAEEYIVEARVEEGRGRSERSLEMLDEALGRYPDNPLVILTRANYRSLWLADDGALPDCIRLWRQAEASGDAKLLGDAARTTGNLYHRRGDNARSIEAYDAAVACPDFGAGWATQAMRIECLLEMDRWEEALTASEQLVVKTQAQGSQYRLGHAILRRGKARLLGGQAGRAMDDFRLAGSLHGSLELPAHGLAMLFVVLALVALERVEEARKALAIIRPDFGRSALWWLRFTEHLLGVAEGLPEAWPADLSLDEPHPSWTVPWLIDAACSAAVRHTLTPRQAQLVDACRASAVQLWTSLGLDGRVNPGAVALDDTVRAL